MNAQLRSGDPAIDAPLPESIPAEQALLGGLLLGGSWNDIADRVRAVDFVRGDHRHIFEAAAKLAVGGKSIDTLTLEAQLQDEGTLRDVGGLAYLGTLAKETPGYANIRDYADRVHELALKRRVFIASRDATAAMHRGDQVAAADAMARGQAALAELNQADHRHALPFDIAPVSDWATKPAPPPRDWIVEGIALAAGRVATLMGNGGFGKSTIAGQIGVATVASRALWGMQVKGGPVVGMFCEDDQDEIERRTRLICEHERIDLATLDNLYLLSRDGEDNVLAGFDRDLIQLTDAYRRLDATLAAIRPRVTIIDTAADVFAGDFMSTTHVRQFIKIALGGLCKRHGTAILLLAHPSASGMNSGDGGGFSTAWHNSVRSRLYLRAPKTEDKEAAADRRVLEVKKSNYGPAGVTIPLIYDRGQFVLDADPIDEGAAPARAKAGGLTKLGMAIMTYMQKVAASGQVVIFKSVFDALKADGHVDDGEYDAVRKPVQRALKQLVDEGLLLNSNVPRGYRIPQASSDGA